MLSPFLVDSSGLLSWTRQQLECVYVQGKTPLFMLIQVGTVSVFCVCVFVCVIVCAPAESTFSFTTGWIYKQEWEQPPWSESPLDSASLNNNCCERDVW